MTDAIDRPVTHVVVLAGGLGTRLSPIMKDTPKVLAPVAGRPFLDWKLDEFIRNAITHVTLLLGHGSALVIDYIAERNYPLSITTALDGPKLCGTGGAVMNILKKQSHDFYLTYGDSLLDMPYQDLYRSRQQMHTPHALAVTSTIGAADRPNCEITDGLITRHDKSDTAGMTATDYGLMLFNPQSLTKAIAVPTQPLDLAHIVNTLAQRHLLAAHSTHHPYWEIGTPDSLAQVTEHLRASKSKESSHASE